MNADLTSFDKQSGNVLVMTALTLFVILGMAGLALDMGHSYDNKTRLQNSVDAAALSAAMKILEELQANLPAGTNVSVANAETAGTATYQANLDSFGSSWLTSPSAIQYCWSHDLQDFSTCETDLDPDDPVFFVRAQVANTSLNNFFLQLFGAGNTRSVGAIAVAGTIGNGVDCNIAPFFVCDNSPDVNNPDTDCSDGQCFGNPVNTNPAAPPDPAHFFQIDVGAHMTLPVISASCSPPTRRSDPNCVWVQDKATVSATPTNVVITKTASSQWNFNNNITFNGNRLLLNLYDINGQSSGASDVRKNIIIPTSCIDPNDSDTQPGNVSSIDKAINALFGEPPPSNGSVGVPNSINIADYYDYLSANPVSFRYYKLEYDNPSNGFTSPNTRYHQRLKSVPVVKCQSTMGGNVSNLEINGYACFFLNRRMHNPSDPVPLRHYAIDDNNEDFIIAEHINNQFCPPVEGVQGGNPTSVLDAKIVLFQSYESRDS